jgi:hypothetical protein
LAFDFATAPSRLFYGSKPSFGLVAAEQRRFSGKRYNLNLNLKIDRALDTAVLAETLTDLIARRPIHLDLDNARVFGKDKDSG